jgi:hypothetical protein
MLLIIFQRIVNQVIIIIIVLVVLVVPLFLSLSLAANKTDGRKKVKKGLKFNYFA